MSTFKISEDAANEIMGEYVDARRLWASWQAEAEAENGLDQVYARQRQSEMAGTASALVLVLALMTRIDQDTWQRAADLVKTHDEPSGYMMAWRLRDEMIRLGHHLTF